MILAHIKIYALYIAGSNIHVKKSSRSSLARMKPAVVPSTDEVQITRVIQEFARRNEKQEQFSAYALRSFLQTNFAGQDGKPMKSSYLKSSFGEGTTKKVEYKY